MSVSKPHEERLAAYIRYFENLTPENVDELENLVREDFSFEDPFNQLTNRRDAVRLFRRMFDDMDEPAFNISDSYWTDDGLKAVLKWRFAGSTEKLGDLDFEGLSEIYFDEAGQIISHIDYWDAAVHFYEKIPVLGGILRMIRKKLRLS
jgi:hypothetical protein